MGLFFGGSGFQGIGRVGVPGKVDPTLGWVNGAVPATRPDARRDCEACHGVADHLALTAASTANGIAHEQNLADIVAAEGGAAEVLAGAELTLDRDSVVGV
ncbi:MAG: hypothetical protein ABSA39_01065 [Edaphobacter sp.]